LDANGQTIERIDFTTGTSFNISDVEQAIFVQDHWSVLPRLSLDGGIREEYQVRTSTLRFAPRIAAAWTPVPHDPLVVRAGYGIFYDRVPLGVYSFGFRPESIVTSFDPSGIAAPMTRHFANVVDADSGGGFPLVARGTKSGNFAPHSQTWTIGLERGFRRFLHLQTNYQNSNAGGGILLLPDVRHGIDVHVLSGGGRSVYRQLELSAKMTWKGGQQLLFSYVRSKAQGDLNTFSTYINDFPTIPLRSSYYSNTRGDMPNRFIAWGLLNTPWKMRLAPVFEFHTGQPYAIVQPNRNYVGIPYSDQTRFRNYINLDERLSKDITVKSKYTARISLSVLNVLNHFNPLDVHANTADPLMGTFFGHYKRRYRADFELLF
jgi:hypothetical protein